MTARLLLLSAVAAIAGTAAQAMPVISVSGPGAAAAQAAEAAFLSGATNVATESFEGFAAGTHHPFDPLGGTLGLETAVGTFIGIEPGDGSGACSPGCSDGLLVLDSATTPFNGRYAVEGDNWLDSNDYRTVVWTILPEDMRSGVGFYITDPNDQGGRLSVTTATGALVDIDLGDLFTDDDIFDGGQPNGRLFYVSIFDPAGIVGFALHQDDGNDGYGIDRFTVADIPEPATLATLGMGLLGMGAALRRRRRN